MTQKCLIGIIVLLLGGVAYVLLQPKGVPAPEVPAPEPVVEVVAEPEVPYSSVEVIGASVEGRMIEAYTFGTGTTSLLFVGGIHGGYEWNSSLLAYAMIDEFENNPTWLPGSLSVTIIPILNPDGLYAVTGTEGEFTTADVPDPSVRVAAGRFNANQVDLNRNFGCKWAPESTWRGEVVSAGTAAFSEPEATALRDYVASTSPYAVAFWHSRANNVYASECENGVLPGTLDLMNVYASAADYGAVPVFDAYPVTGDAEGWLASLGIPAVTVELETHNSIEWTRNKAAMEAMFELYQEQ